jgi:hypothetical protein
MVHHGEEDWALSQFLLRWSVTASLNVPQEDGEYFKVLLLKAPRYGWSSWSELC